MLFLFLLTCSLAVTGGAIVRVKLSPLCLLSTLYTEVLEAVCFLSSRENLFGTLVKIYINKLVLPLPRFPEW